MTTQTQVNQTNQAINIIVLYYSSEILSVFNSIYLVLIDNQCAKNDATFKLNVH